MFILKLLHTLQEQRNLFWVLEKICHQFFFVQPWSFPNSFLADHPIKIKNVFFFDLVFLYCLIGGTFEVGVANGNKKRMDRFEGPHVLISDTSRKQIHVLAE